MAKRTAHQELESLQQASAGENLKSREAEDDLRRAHAKVEQALQDLEAAYVQEDEPQAAKARKALALAQDEREDRQHRLNARRQRAEQATATATSFRADHAEQLIAERHDDAHTLAVELQEVLEKAVALDAKWSEHAQQTNQLVTITPGSNPRVDQGPAEHAFTHIIRELRHGLGEGNEVVAPVPYWQGRAHREQQDRTHRILRARREGSQLAVEEAQRA
jgi:hypothetical protein